MSDRIYLLVHGVSRERAAAGGVPIPAFFVSAVEGSRLV